MPETKVRALLRKREMTPAVMGEREVTTPDEAHKTIRDVISGMLQKKQERTTTSSSFKTEKNSG